MEGKVKNVLRLSGFETLQNIFESGGTTFEVEKNTFEVDFWTPFRVYFCLGC